MGKVDFIKRSIGHWLRSYPFWVLVALGVGFLIFYAFVTKPVVGIIKISDLSLDIRDAAQVVKMLNYAEETDEIKALVLEIDSPGGGVVPTEEIYLNVLRLRSKKPVVAYVNQWSLSGGYYISVAANYIYAKPSSLVGSIGVWTSLPPEREQPEEDIMGSGPFKTATPRSDAVNWLEMIKEGFIRAVISQRGDKLKISKEELSKAALYLGVEGLRYGLIDEIGSSADAVQKAADLAGIKRYEVVDINQKLNLLPPWYERWWTFGEEGAPIEPKTLEPLSDKLPLFYYVPYMPPR